MMADGKAVKKVPRAVAGKDKSGVTTGAWGAAKKLNVVTRVLYSRDFGR